jgi:hypothetical protein
MMCVIDCMDHVQLHPLTQLPLRTSGYVPIGPLNFANTCR